MSKPFAHLDHASSRRIRPNFFALLLLAAFATTQTVAAVPGSQVTAHYLVLQTEADGLTTPLFHRFVQMAGPMESLAAEDAERRFETLSNGSDGRAVRVELVDSQDRVVHRQVQRVDPWIRAEFDKPGVLGHHAPMLGDPTFVVRVPFVPGTRLDLSGFAVAEFDLETLAAESAQLPLAGFDPGGRVETKGAMGDPANRVDLLFMGDGYTSQATFDSDIQGLIADFFGISPYGEYESFVNSNTLYTASSQAGADHPPYDPACNPSDLSCCAATEAQSDPLAGTYVDTAFDGRFCASNIFRLLVVDTGKILTAAAADPDWDHILVLVNDDTYGGSGGFLAVASTHPSAVDVMRHEYGHSFTDLADEYDTPFPGFPACSDVSGPSPCEANVTDETTRALIKWEPWIDPGTPVPTPEGSPTFGDDVGLFEGARYLSTDMYRPRDSCLMRVLGVPFGEVCAQEYVLKLFEGGWGVPAGGIDPIEPGSESPTPGSVMITEPTDFSFDLLVPTSGPAPTVRWLVDGVVQAETGTTFNFFPSVGGPVDLTLEVDAANPWVHPEMAGSSLDSQRQWTVEVTGLIFTDAFESGDTTAWSAQVE